MGLYGTILHTANGGATWSPQVSGTTNTLKSVAFPDGDNQNGWAVGESGTILHTTNGGVTWSPQVSGTVVNLQSVSSEEFTNAPGPNIIYASAVGDNGTALGFCQDGIPAHATWVALPNPLSGTSLQLTSVTWAPQPPAAGGATTAGFAVANDGTILRGVKNDGGALTGWTNVSFAREAPNPSTGRLLGVCSPYVGIQPWGAPAVLSEAWAVGDRDVLHYGAGVCPVPAGSGVSASPGSGPGSGISLIFSNVISGGTCSIVTMSNPPALPSGLTEIGNCFDVTTNARFSGQITVTVPYDPSLVTGNQANLELYHYNGSNWENTTVSVDTVNHTITGRTTSLSPFVVISPSSTSAPASSTWSLLLMGIAGIIMLARRTLKAKQI